MVQPSQRVLLVVTTVGRDSLRALMQSVSEQTQSVHEVVITDQSGTDVVRGMVSEAPEGLQVRVVTSTPGASAGRNAALQALTPTDIVFFTDDDCELAQDAIERAATALEAYDMVTGRLISTLGERGQDLVHSVTKIEPSNVWRLGIEPAMAARMNLVRALVGFDETLGVGGPTRWQSGEGTEFMLRAVATGARLAHVPDIVVRETSAPIDGAALRRKTRRYARGTGRVYAMHYPIADRVKVVLRPAAGALIRALQGEGGESLRLANAALGRVESLLPAKPEPSAPSRYGRRL